MQGTMRLLADENVPGPLVRALREAGHDTTWMVEEEPGAPDTDVLARTRHEDRILLTFDRDFGALTFGQRQLAGAGVIFFRVPPMDPVTLTSFCMETLEARTNWRGHFSVVTPERIRMRPLPENR